MLLIIDVSRHIAVVFSKGIHPLLRGSSEESKKEVVNQTNEPNSTSINVTIEESSDSSGSEMNLENMSEGYTYSPESPLNIYVLNVGYGNSILLIKGDFHMLIDAGDPTGGNKIISKMKDLNVDDIDVMVITHPTKKRLSGVERIIDSFTVEEVWDNGVVNELYAPIREKILSKNIKLKSVKAGDCFQYNGINITIYNPYEETFNPENENLNSIVMQIKDRTFSFLVTSDLENIELNNILSDHPSLYSTIVEVPKNGKSSIRDLASTNQMIIRLIDATRPDAMIISVGPNDEGAPSPQLIKAIETQSIKIYRTDRDGNILISYQNGTYQIYKNK